MKPVGTLLIGVLLLTAGCRTPPDVTPLLSVSELGSWQLMLPDGNVTLRIAEHGAPPDDWREDWMWITMHDGDAQLTYLPVHSSYGTFQLDVVDLNADQVPELVLITGVGRGTSARSEALSVYRLLDRSLLHLVSSTAYSGFAGSGLDWRYSHRYADTDGNGTTDLVLELGRTPEVHPVRGNTAWVPPESVKIMKWERDGSNITLHGTQ